MIPIAKETQVRLLLKKGLSKREIARRVGVDRKTVAKIERVPKIRKRICRPQKFKKLKKSRKCEICGGKVKIWPCLLCHPECGYYDDPKLSTGSM